jgi:hypothetical protein
MNIKETVFNTLVDILIEARGDILKRYSPDAKVPERTQRPKAPKGGGRRPRLNSAGEGRLEKIGSLADKLHLHKSIRSIDRGHELSPETRSHLASRHHMSPELAKKLGMSAAQQRDTHATDHQNYQDSIRWKKGGR